MPIPDAQRRTVKLQLRVPPEVAAELRRRGLTHPRGASGVVAELVLVAAPAEGRVDDV